MSNQSSRKILKRDLGNYRESSKCEQISPMICILINNLVKWQQEENLNGNNEENHENRYSPIKVKTNLCLHVTEHLLNALSILQEFALSSFLNLF